MKRSQAAPRRPDVGEYAVRREPFETESRLVARMTGPRYDDFDRVYLCERQSAAEKLAALLNAARDLARDWRGMRTTGVFSNTDPEFDVRHSIVTLVAGAIEGPKPDVYARRKTPPTRGGPSEQFPDAPYCKPDQSCCDFICGN
jgi:hypothetical protein